MAKTRKNKKSSIKKASKKSPQSMEELLKQTGYQLHGWQRGDTVEGIITEKTGRAIYIDIGGKSDAIVIDRELKAAKAFIEGLKVGDKVKAVVTQVENDKGQTILSLKRAALDSFWQEFEEKLKTGTVVKVRGVEINRGGLIVEAKGLQGFIPASQFGAKWADKIDQLIGKELEVKVIEVNRSQNRLIFSEREVSEAELIKELEKKLKKVKVGGVFSGQVSGVMPFGLFVKVVVKKGIELEGLVHISEISWEKVENPAELYREGDEVKVKVLAVDKKSGKLNLSIKQLEPDPWEEIEKKYKPEAKVKGEVVNLAPFGVFVRLEPGIEGLIHISKIPADQSIKVGSKVDCFIESINKENRRLSLNLVLKEKPVGYK